VPLPEVKLDGQSLMPIIKSAAAPTHHKVMHWHFEKRWAVREGDWKLISAPHGEPDFLGNLADAEPERRNYLKEKPEIVGKLLKLHNDWINDVMPEKK
jgi:arylsulfatase A-like enzyme